MTVRSFMRMEWFVDEPDKHGWIGKDIPDDLYQEYVEAYTKFNELHMKLSDYDDVDTE